ncbi:hypothetical protein HDU77_005492 [Chytriomyces hyalinus]|nr:hypothetical protein HDU77_005492 [Chytriomyces hyalinus]
MRYTKCAEDVQPVRDVAKSSRSLFIFLGQEARNDAAGLALVFLRRYHASIDETTEMDTPNNGSSARQKDALKSKDDSVSDIQSAIVRMQAVSKAIQLVEVSCPVESPMNENADEMVSEAREPSWKEDAQFWEALFLKAEETWDSESTERFLAAVGETALLQSSGNYLTVRPCKKPASVIFGPQLAKMVTAEMADTVVMIINVWYVRASVILSPGCPQLVVQLKQPILAKIEPVHIRASSTLKK